MKRNSTYRLGKAPQRFCEFITAANGLSSDKALCLGAGTDGTVYIGTDCGLNYTKADGSFGSFPCGEVSNIFAAKNGKVYFTSANILYCAENGKIAELQQFEEDITGISGEDRTFLVTASVIYELVDGEFKPFFGTEMPAWGLTCACGRIVSYSGRCLMIFAGKRKNWRCLFPEHTPMPEFKINCVSFDKKLGFLWMGTDKGAFIYDNHCSWYGHKEINALPEEEIFSINFADDGRILLGSEAGLIVIAKGKAKYLPATRWVCEEKVNDAICIGDTIWTATDSGVSKITEKEMSLKEKADYCYELTEKLYLRREGFLCYLRDIENCDINTGVPAISDNDGLWTQTYLGALCYCYAVTKDEKVLESARRCMNAMAKLTKITGIKGFTARAIRYEGDRNYGKNLDMQIDGGEWHKAPDGSCEWLGETSSDEMTGHFFGFSLYYDFCADEKEKEFIKEIICDIVDHILANKYRLHDIDGLPTTWACWDPEELNRNCMWQWEKCINSLEILTFLKVAYHISGNEKYNEEYLHLGLDEHYFLNIAQHKKEDGHVTHIDDNLGFLCSQTLLRLEEDEAIRAYILMGLRHHWNYERIERNAMFNFVFGAFADDVCDIDASVEQLRCQPLDFVRRNIYNENRKNLVYDTQIEQWGGDLQLVAPLDIDERSIGNSDSNFFHANSGRPDIAECPSCYLLPYWLGRYYGLIDEAD